MMLGIPQDWEGFKGHLPGWPKAHLLRAVILTAVFMLAVWLVRMTPGEVPAESQGSLIFLCFVLVAGIIVSLFLAEVSNSRTSGMGVSLNGAHVVLFKGTPENAGRETVLVTPCVSSRGQSRTIRSVWISFKMRMGHQVIRLHASDLVQHQLSGWCAWTDNPHGRIHFVDPEGRSRTAQSDTELDEILTIIERGLRFADWSLQQKAEADRQLSAERRAAGEALQSEAQQKELYESQVTELGSRVQALCEYFPESGPPRGAPIQELRRVVETLGLRYVADEFASDEEGVRLKVEDLKRLPDLKFARWSQPARSSQPTVHQISRGEDVSLHREGDEHLVAPSNVDG